MHYVIGTDNQRLWRWVLKAANGKAIAVSSESYHNKSDCLYAIDLVRSTLNAPIYEA
jgi:uncharacterized protein